MIISWVGGALASKNKAQSLDHFCDKPPTPLHLLSSDILKLRLYKPRKGEEGTNMLIFCEFFRHCSHFHPYPMKVTVINLRAPYRIIRIFYIIDPLQ